LISSVVVDTDVVSYVFKGDSRAVLYGPHLLDKLTVVSFMTIAELDRWQLQHGWGNAKRARLRKFLDRHLISFADRALCAKWAEAVVSAHHNGFPIGAADAWVAATALLHGIPLVTHNRSHYLGVEGLTLVSEAAQ
jgi:tRNA(fMet)-specific endonuclease VapC